MAVAVAARTFARFPRPRRGVCSCTLPAVITSARYVEPLDPDLGRAHIRRAVHTEREHPAREADGARRDARIIGVGHEHVAGAGLFKDFGLRVGNRIGRFEEPHVRVADVGPHACSGSAMPISVRISPRMIHAELDDSDLRPRPQLEERERKADMVVEVALVRNTRYLAPRNSAVISLVVVFPALPVIATTFVPDRRRTSRAIDCSARVVSATRTRTPGCRPCSPIRAPRSVSINAPIAQAVSAA